MTYYTYPAYRYRALVIKVHYVKIMIIKKKLIAGQIKMV